jgi:alpha-amylase/alpha-mannosidase (GH57 family)
MHARGVTGVAILWHMHQPVYRDPLSGTTVLPWVRLHALKDYWGMVSLLEETPGVHVTFNLVPCLLDQVEACARGEAHEPWQEVALKPAALLTEQERIFALSAFFQSSRYVMQGLPRLVELRARWNPGNETAAIARAAAAFTAQDLRDLQVLAKLAWFDRDWARRDAGVSGLLAKGRGYGEEDKLLLAERERALLAEVVPAYRRAAAEGRIELATSPYFHPILPLLCDTEAHHEAHPEAPLPVRYRHPEDAADQIRRALARHRAIFGIEPVGLWPSEGSISEEAVRVMAEVGVRWTASDEAVLERSLGTALSTDRLYRPWVRRTPAGDVKLLFRDRQISDLIGFVYSRWNPADAAADLLDRLRRVGEAWRREKRRGDPLVSIILDGENAWEHYPDGGRVFLRALYRGIEEDPGLEGVTVSEALESAKPRVLRRVFAGSWIHGDFSVWIGHADDRRAWDLLGETRVALHDSEGRLEPASLEKAWETYRSACGSDWCWWYGDDRSSDDDRVFDRLFRRHLQAVYMALGLAVPEALGRTLITTRHPHTSAGVYRPAPAGAMVHAGATVREIRYGVGDAHLNLLVQTAPAAAGLPAGIALLVTFPGRGGLRYRVVPAEGGGAIERQQEAGASWASCGARAIAGEVMEVAIPLSELAAEGETAPLAFHVALLHGGEEWERHPDGQLITVNVEEGPHEP